MNMDGRKILVVEDHRDLLELLQIELKFLGWESIPAQHGREALEKLKDIRPAAILLDMVMPEMDGFELAEHLKNNPDYRDIPILAVTGLAMPGDREKCLAAGCDDYIAKPVTHRDLQKYITRFLPVTGVEGLPN